MQPLNAGVIGAGLRTTAFCSYAKHNPGKLKITALCDINLDKAKLLNSHYKLDCKLYEEFTELVSDDTVDAVIISTPDYLHVEPAVAALNSNKHVYLEKPLATTVEDCNKIIEASKNSKSLCYLGFNMRHSPVHEKIYNLIQEGELGKVTTIEANEWYYDGRTYFRRWNRLRKYGGGLWLTKACHDFDLISWIAGGRPETVCATSSLSHYNPIANAGPRCRDCAIKDSCPDFYDIHKPIEDELQELWRQLQLKMDQEGASAPDICLYNSPKDTFDNGIAMIEYDNDIRATYTVNVLAAKTTRQMRVIGTEGMVEVDMEEGIVKYTQRRTHQEAIYDLTEQIKGFHGGADNKILDDFINVCKDGKKPRSGLQDGLLSVKLSLAARESADNIMNRVILQK